MSRYKRASEDTKKESRLKARECKTCYYLVGKMGGSAMTKSNCTMCGVGTVFGSTTTDKTCKACSDKYQVCVHCGGDIEMRDKRRKLEYS